MDDLQKRSSLSIGDDAFGNIIGAETNGDLVSYGHKNVVLSHLSTKVAQCVMSLAFLVRN